MQEKLPTGIRSFTTRNRADGSVRELRILFGPHHYIELRHTEAGRTELYLGATHHGIRADATDVPSELEKMVERLRELYPENRTD